MCTSQQVNMVLENHPENVHTCKLCRVKSKRLYNLRRHMRNNHKMTTDDVCRYCSPRLDVIDEDLDMEGENTERDSKEEENTDTRL